MSKNFTSHSQDESFEWAVELGINANPGDTFALIGDLGCGKTIIAKGIAKGLKINEEITSPTFTLLEIYEEGRLPFYHFDLYRIEDDREFDNLYFEEYWEAEGISVIEWADKAKNRIPVKSTIITIEYTGESTRSITIEYPGN